MALRTWHIEAFVIGIVLIFVSFLAGGYEWIGAIGVFAMSRKLFIGDRLREKELLNIETSVDCAKWLTSHVIFTEVIFAVYFLLEESYTALAGVFVVLGYTLWRKIYRTYINPLDLFSV